MSDVYLDGAAYACGELRPIEDLPELQQRPDLLAYFKRTGLCTYSHSTGDPYTLARQSAEKSLALAGVPPDAIDLVFFSSLTFQNSDEYRAGSARLLLELGLRRAYPIGIHLSGCGNVHTSIQTAQLFMAGGRARAALVITADVTPPAKSRLVAPDVAVYSDAAASFVLAADPSLRYRVLAAERHIDAAMWNTDPRRNLLVMLRDTRRGMKTVLDALLTAAQRRLEDVRYVLPINSNGDVIETVVRILDLPRERFHTQLARLAHSYASDATINLAELTSADVPRSGDALLLLGSNYYMWGATLLERT
jgi:3-oxoacyl-[acyl-carrier-protein] synthase-3